MKVRIIIFYFTDKVSEVSLKREQMISIVLEKPLVSDSYSTVLWIFGSVVSKIPLWFLVVSIGKS